MSDLKGAATESGISASDPLADVRDSIGYAEANRRQETQFLSMPDMMKETLSGLLGG